MVIRACAASKSVEKVEAGVYFELEDTSAVGKACTPSTAAKAVKRVEKCIMLTERSKNEWTVVALQMNGCEYIPAKDWTRWHTRIDGRLQQQTELLYAETCCR